MRYLLDTCTFLWLTLEPAKLSSKAVQVITDPANSVFLSAVSTWEIALLYALGRITLQNPPAVFVPQQRSQHGVLPLPLQEEATLVLPSLPALHKDPFDRMLVCQAIQDNLVILTPDSLIRQYAVQTDW